MRTQMVVTDLTRMSRDRICLAGYRPDGECVRPLFARGSLTEAWL